MKRIVGLIMLLFTLPLVAQTWESVKRSNDYIWGEGTGTTVAEADRKALNDLISKISLQVSSAVNSHEYNRVDESGVTTESQFQSAIKTYSQATLNNTEKIILQNEPDAHVGRWIKRAELDRIFEGRKNKIRDYVASALRAEQQGKVDMALKDFYWALELLKSLQYPGEEKYTTPEGTETLLLRWIPEQMGKIFKDINVAMKGRNGDDLEVYITYKGKPVNSLDYTYFDGRDWSNIYSANDGAGVLELAPGYTADNIKLKVEYTYLGESHIDREVESVLNAISGTSMRDAYKDLKVSGAPKGNLARNERKTESFSSVPPAIFKQPEEYTPDGALRKRVERVIAAVGKRDYDSVEDCFTLNGLDIYRRLIKYGKAKLVGNNDLRFYKSEEGIIARGVQMAFSFSTGLRKSFVENLVFTVTPDGKIDNIVFGLGQTAQDDILGKGVWDEKVRLAIMSFLENYQTAYALKRLDYIETIFDDDAVIITGTVVKRKGGLSAGSDGKTLSFGNEIIEYNRYDKDSYLKHLKRSFDSKEFINIRFASNEVRKLGKGGEVYGIQIAQEYYSSNYGDKGYLFLMIDMNDAAHPVIKLRTWQPEKDPNFGIYGPEHFN
ncbi:MAG: LPP20 family lipoprotein [Muribaculaceae bacterium]|nr:LPP20 family lipoprotein [Muribaculaceae bacterium]